MHATCQGFEHRRGRRVAAALAVLLAAAVVAGCTGNDDARSDDATTTTTTAEERTAEPERFDGSLEDFYRVPDPLPEGGPGTVIRTMPVEPPDEASDEASTDAPTDTSAQTSALRIMYVTTDAAGDDRAATGVVHVPRAAAPEEGWPVVAWAHGTSGLASQCAPSRSGGPPPDYGIEGVHVSPDYLGLGPEGELHPYLSSIGEGHAVIDSVAAVRSLPETHAGDEWVVVGVSQGGHAALVTNEMAADRLPDAELVGAAALAPGAELSTNYGDELQIRVITTMALVGAAAEDDTIVLEEFLGPDALAASAAIETGCVSDIIDAMLPVAAADDYFIKEPRTDAVGKAWLERNDPGKVVGAAPLLLVQGGADILVLPARTAALRERLCGIGQPVDMLEVPTADHDSVVEQSLTEVGAWLRARLDGEPAVDEC
ncbi:MAG: lipase family protein [Actinomycetota bacterium]|nr:lipase family protein [Actinomycetota bacterium]